MKILIANKFFFQKGGQETVAFEQEKLLTKNGHEVAFFSMHHPNNQADYEYSKYFAQNVDYSKAGEGLSVIDKLKLAKKFINNPQAAERFEQMLLDFKPDIIHCHGIAHQLTPSILPVAAKYDIPVFQTLHDYQLICPSYNLLKNGKTPCNGEPFKNKQLSQCILNKCTKNMVSASCLSTIELMINQNKYIQHVEKFITPSKFLGEILVKNGIAKESIVNINNFINHQNIQPCYDSQEYFIFAGRLSEEKGLLTLVKAFKEVPGEKLLIIGEGALEGTIKSYIQEHNIKNIELTGFMQKDELNKHLEKAKCLILPSEWYENQPMCIIEAFFYGKPAIGSRLGGITEMIKDGYTGFLYESGNVNELAENIRKFANNPSLSVQLGHNAREYAMENYTPESHYEKLIKLYSSVIQEGKSDEPPKNFV